jgi:hypothetical protein
LSYAYEYGKMTVAYGQVLLSYVFENGKQQQSTEEYTSTATLTYLLELVPDGAVRTCKQVHNGW